MARLTVFIFLFFVTAAYAETAWPEFCSKVDLAPFKCYTRYKDKSWQGIRRVCYDPRRKYLIIDTAKTFGTEPVTYLHCDIDAATVQELLTASHMQTFYINSIRGGFLSNFFSKGGEFGCNYKTDPICAAK